MIRGIFQGKIKENIGSYIRIVDISKNIHYLFKFGTVKTYNWSLTTVQSKQWNLFPTSFLIQ